MTLNRQVAIKVLNEDYCNDEVRIQSFENEARLTAQVNHPNVIKVYSVGRAYGRFYLVMELLEGESFERIVAKGEPVSESRVLNIATQVAAGLQAAKKAGMIHRDVKPGNIHIDRDDRARLLDFGLALITQDGRAQATEIWATPYYVPPEALERGIEDFRSDIYAFGATLYHALAGKPPFKTTTNATNILRKAKESIPRLCKVAPHVSPNTGITIDRMMAYSPEKRWSSYGELIDALQTAGRTIGQPASIPSSPPPDRSKRRKKNHLILFGIPALLFSLLAIFIATRPNNDTPEPTDNTAQNTPLPPPEEIPLDPPAFNPIGTTAPDSENLPARWRVAREALKNADYRTATRLLSQIASDPSVPKSNRAFAMLEASISENLAGRPGSARGLAAQIQGITKDSQNDLKQIIKLNQFSERLVRLTPLKKSELLAKPKNIVETMILFATSLKQWEQGQWKEALPHFATVRSYRLHQDLSWFEPYQALADDYLADGETLAKAYRLKEPKNTGEAEKKRERLNNLLKELRTRGRAPYNIRQLITHFARLQKKLPKSQR